MKAKSAAEREEHMNCECKVIDEKTTETYRKHFEEFILETERELDRDYFQENSQLKEILDTPAPWEK